MKSFAVLVAALSAVIFFIFDRRSLKLLTAQKQLIQEQQQELNHLNSLIGQHQRALHLYFLLHYPQEE